MTKVAKNMPCHEKKLGYLLAKIKSTSVTDENEKYEKLNNAKSW